MLLGFAEMLGSAFFDALPAIGMGLWGAYRENKRAKDEKSRLSGDFYAQFVENKRRASEDVRSMFSGRDAALAGGNVRDPDAKWRRDTMSSRAIENYFNTFKMQASSVGEDTRKWNSTYTRLNPEAWYKK